MKPGVLSEAMRDKLRFQLNESPDNMALENEQRLRALDALQGNMMGVTPQDSDPSFEPDVASRVDTLPDQEAIKFLLERMKGVRNA